MPPDAHPTHHLVLRLGMDAPRTAAPGELMIYCNYNYTLLGAVVERIAGKPLPELARERLFEPLGMQSSDYVVRDDMRERLVVRPEGAPMTHPVWGVETTAFERTPNGAWGAYSTARDMAIFAQTFLNGGSYGEARILSRPAVQEMTQNRIPGVPARAFSRSFPEGGYGYGWMVCTWVRWRYLCGTTGLGSFTHTGAGGNACFIDPTNETVQVVLEVCMDLSDDFEPRSGIFDRFQSVIASAIDD